METAAVASGAEQDRPVEVDSLWDGFSRGEPAARDRLLALHYNEFRRVARRVLSGDAPTVHMQPTDLAHEAAIRLLRQDQLSCRDGKHLLALSARVMRQVLLDEIRRVRAVKRSPPVLSRWCEPGADAAPPPMLDLEAFDEALGRLAELDPERAKIVEMRFYAGLTLEEIAEVTGESLSTIKRRWRVARAWLADALAFE